MNILKKLNDSQNTFNPMEFRLCGNTSKEDYVKHKYNVALLIGMFNNEIEDKHYQLITENIELVHKEKNINSATNTLDMDSKDFPLLEDLLKVVKYSYKENIVNMNNEMKKVYTEVIDTINLMITKYGLYFNQYSNFEYMNEKKTKERSV